MTVSVLERPIYTEAEAARLLRLSPSTLHYWLEGGVRRGVSYPPVIRAQPHGGHPPVTWAEFVEAGLLREYRRTKDVPMRNLRAFIGALRDQLGVPFPLATRRPFVVENHELVHEAQDQAGLTGEWRLVEAVDGRLSLLPRAADFERRVDWVDDVARAWRPDDDPNSPVLIDPERRFGRPMVGGISTIVLWEHHQAGEPVEDIANTFDLDESLVEWALRYEEAAPGRRAA